jgi:hypothetical protein
MLTLGSTLDLGKDIVGQTRIRSHRRPRTGGSAADQREQAVIRSSPLNLPRPRRSSESDTVRAEARSPPQRELSEAYLAALHELRERLTATTNYLAAGLRLSEIESAPAVMQLRHTEILEKAFGQVSRANEVIRRFRKLLDPA